MRTRLQHATMLLLLSTGIACGTPVDTVEDYVPAPSPQMPTDEVPEPTLPAQAFVDRTLYLSGYTEEQLDDIAESPIAFFQLRLLLSEEAAPIIRSLRERNPDLIVIGIVQQMSYSTGWIGDNQAQRFPMSADLYRAMRGHEAYRPDGVMATMWTDSPMINPWHPSKVYNVGLLHTYLDVISRHASRYPDVFDGIMHDYLSKLPWVYPRPPDPTMTADFDGDGIEADEDEDDRVAWVEWQRAMLLELQIRFGEGLIQIGNGRLPHSDEVAAGRLAGITYENFPTTPWVFTDLEGMDLMLEHHAEGYLTPRRGRTWSLLWDPHARRPDFVRVASMLSGQFYGLSETASWPGDDAEAGTAGSPAASVTRTQDELGKVLFERQFSGGVASLRLSGAGSTEEMGFAPE